MSFSNQSFSRPGNSLFELEFPQTVGTYTSYTDAQKAVDYLADNKFEVQNLAIVGTGLRSVERVLGRRSWRTVIGQGVQSGVTTGLLITVVMVLFGRPTSWLALLAVALGIGILLGIGFQAIGFALSRGRDFTSVSHTVAAQYEVLCEHKLAAKARELLQQMPGARAAYFQ